MFCSDGVEIANNGVVEIAPLHLRSQRLGRRKVGQLYAQIGDDLCNIDRVSAEDGAQVLRAAATDIGTEDIDNRLIRQRPTHLIAIAHQSYRLLLLRPCGELARQARLANAGLATYKEGVALFLARKHLAQLA